MPAQPEPAKSLRAAIERLTERVRQLENRSPFFDTGMTPQGAGVTNVYQTFVIQEGATSQIAAGGDLDVNGNANIDGTLNVGGPAQFGGDVDVVSGQVHSGNFVAGTSGWQIAGDGSAEFSNITLHNIPNSALARPVDFGNGLISASNWATTTTYAAKVSTTITPPAGASFGIFIVRGFASATNSTGTTSTFEGQVWVGSSAVADGGWGDASAATGAVAQKNFLLLSERSVTPGVPETVTLEVRTGAAWAANALNYASIRAYAIWHN